MFFLGGGDCQHSRPKMEHIAARFIRQYGNDTRLYSETELSRILASAEPWYRTLLVTLFAYVCETHQDWTYSSSDVELLSWSDYRESISRRIPDTQTLETVVSNYWQRRQGVSFEGPYPCLDACMNTLHGTRKIPSDVRQQIYSSLRDDLCWLVRHVTILNDGYSTDEDSDESMSEE
jgi:hypothetical protein